MKTQIEALHSDLQKALERVQNEQPEPIRLAMESVVVLKTGMEKLKQIVLKNKFANPSEEIAFFKYTKPKFLAPLLFYNMMAAIEIKCPEGTKAMIEIFLIAEIEKINRFAEENRSFYTYFRCHATDLDDKYFLRKHRTVTLEPGELHFDADPRFSTYRDELQARIMANQMLLKWLREAISSLGKKDSAERVDANPAQKLPWTESKAAMIELIYGLYSSGAIDHGNADLKSIAVVFESVFGIQLGDLYRGFVDLRMRKTGRLKFLDSMMEKLMRRMEEADER